MTGRTFRWIIQAAMVVLMAWIGLRHQIVSGAAPLDSYCPFGAIETLPSLLNGTGFIGKVGTSNLVLLGALGIVTLALSGAFCGWLCPFGALQDLLAGIGRTLTRGRKHLIPARVHGVLRHLRWAVLALIVWMSAKYLYLWFADYDPFRVFFHFKFETTLAIVLLVATVIGGLFVERFFCLYACPLGALVGGVGLAGLSKVRRNSDTCIDCGVCARVCPSRIAVDSVKTVRHQHCTMCAECVESCPVPGALVISTGAAGESFRPVVVGVATLALFFALIGTGRAMGWWQPGSACAGCSKERAAAITESPLASAASTVQTATHR